MLDAGTRYRHIKTGTIYTILGVGRHKRDGETWVLAVIYRNPQGELFSRELSDFTGFEFFAHADAP